MLKQKDILFIRDTIMDIASISTADEEVPIQSMKDPKIEEVKGKVKKWTPVEVGRLLFCLW